MLRLLLLLCICSSIHGQQEESPPEVTIQQGKLKGFKLTSRKGKEFFAFQRIPYVKSPVGDLRFRNPQPLEKWDGVLDATQDVPKCIQRDLFRTEQSITGQEDCLYINVYTPQLEGERPLDVMVYIHGGGYFAGWSTKHGPAYLLDKDIVLVHFNYRLGPLGFLSTQDSACPGNFGLKDQVAALIWVQDNIASFGGNPNSVTLFGESAGAGSVHYHMLSPASRGLFHRAISQSGNAFCGWAFAAEGAAKKAEKLAASFGCPTEPSSALIECLREKDAAEIIGKDTIYMEWHQYPHMPFRPVLETGEDAFITGTPEEMIKNITSPVPWILGITSEEGAFVAARIYGNNYVSEFDEKFETLLPLTMTVLGTPEQKMKTARRIRKFYFGEKRIDEATRSSLVNMYTDGHFLHGTNRAARHHVEEGSAPVYYYLFAFRGSKSISAVVGDPVTNYGVCHADDLMYLFHGNVSYNGPMPTEAEEKMIDTMTTIWTNFAHTGNPTPSAYNGVIWPQVSNPTKMEYVRIDKDGLHVKKGLWKERTKFWDTLRDKMLSKKDEL